MTIYMFWYKDVHDDVKQLKAEDLEFAQEMDLGIKYKYRTGKTIVLIPWGQVVQVQYAV